MCYTWFERGHAPITINNVTSKFSMDLQEVQIKVDHTEAQITAMLPVAVGSKSPIGVEQ